MLAYLIVGCGVLGLVIGSFLNVVIYRVPRHESIVSPRSRCTTCGTLLLERDNIPVFSWLVLKGKCRSCKSPISARYPLIELVCAGLFAGCAARLGYNWDLPAFLIFLAALLALSAIDVELLVLPKVIVYPSLISVGALLTLDAGLTSAWHRFLIAVLCAAGWFVLFFVINFASPRALGFGDVRLSPLLGLGLGWLGIRFVILGFFAANLVGALIGIALIAAKKMSRDQPIPYGVFLALGAGIALFAGPEILVHFHTIK